MKEFNQKIQKKFTEMCKLGKLFRVKLSGAEIWQEYLKSFGPEDNPVFRDPSSTTKNCNHCNNFIRRYGNIVAIDDDNNIITIFDVVLPKDSEYVKTAKTLTKLIQKSPIQEVFFETFAELNSLPYEACSKSNAVFRLGTASNVKRYTKEEAEKYGVVKANEIRTFNHLHLDVPKEFVDQSGKSVEAIMGEYRDAKNVFQRAMEEISRDTLALVIDLINQGSLLDGTTHLSKVKQMLVFKSHYDTLGSKEKDNWCWLVSYKLPIAKFKNELVGVLCSELSEGKELNDACKAWNMRVDPKNYMKATAPITQKQINEAKTFVEENGYVDSFNRRMATMEDIKVSEILHANAGDGKIASVSIFDTVKKSPSTRHKRNEFDGIEEVSIDKFMKDILPGCTSVEAFLQNNHEGNMVTLTTANVKESKPIFKWKNNYSWTFNGNLAGKSQIKEAVKVAGGNVSGVLRGSMIWNESSNDRSDLDLWCKQPDGVNIGFSSGYRKDTGDRFTTMSGQLDLDNTDPGTKIGVENIYFQNLSKMKDGVYTFWVNQYSARNSKGFKFEIEFNGEIYIYTYNSPVRDNVVVAKVTLKKGNFTIEHVLPVAEEMSKDIYGLETNQFHKVNLVCLSPNHWDNNKSGNKHYMFMLEKCKAPADIRSFHIENLIPKLATHRKVLEVLGNTTMIPSTDKQLSGLGFNSTVKEELILRLAGSFKRVIKVKF